MHNRKVRLRLRQATYCSKAGALESSLRDKNRLAHLPLTRRLRKRLCSAWNSGTQRISLLKILLVLTVTGALVFVAGTGGYQAGFDQGLYLGLEAGILKNKRPARIFQERFRRFESPSQYDPFMDELRGA